MNLRIRRLALRLATGLALAAAASSGWRRASAAETVPAVRRVREPAVAGGFYPKDPAELAKMVDAFLAAAQPPPIPGELRALICPHAGYLYSGPVAAYGFKLLEGRHYDTVVVMGPSHFGALLSHSVTDADLFRTPLGDVPISAKARQLAAIDPYAFEPPSILHRPDWWQASSRSRPRHETADTWEYSVEAEVPFLQRTLKNFQLVSVVCAPVNPVKSAGGLAQILDDHTLIVVSSDLSHYHPYDEARKLDRRTIENICRLDPMSITDADACGCTPIQTLLYVAQEKGWKARLLNYRNSGDTTGNKADGVVGYAAIAFYSPAAVATPPAPAAAPPVPPAPAGSGSIHPPAAPAPAPRAQFSTADRKFLLALARRAVLASTAGEPPPPVSLGALAPQLAADRGCFVTLTVRGELRGCIGNLLPQGPLARAVVENARNAAQRDPRFPPVTPAEVNQIEIEVSVLTEPKPLAFHSPEELLRSLQPGTDGVVLQIGRRSATYLPQVWEQIPDREEFLNSLAEKAGCPRASWRQPLTAVSTYHVEAFKESELAAAPIP